MSATRRLGRKPIDQLRESPLASHVDAFAQYLRDRCYAAHTIRKYLGCLAQFGRWMGRCQLQAGRLDEDAVERFLDDQLPRCDCAGPVVCTRIDLHAALGHLLVVLRDSGAISERTISTTPVDEELRRFDAQMDHAQGLALKTRTSHLRTIRRLLVGQFGAEAIGRAIVDYLTHERPPSASRAIFVRRIAPCDRPLGPDCVRKAIRQAYARAGLPYTRAHLLRHTMASRLLAGGSSLKEVAVYW